MSDSTCYVLPLAPQDLVAIYKEKEQEENFTLWVNYVKSVEKLSAEHIIIYLANTNFKATFSHIDEDLILAYIKSDFMVDCPTLDRIIVNMLKLKLDHPPTEQERQLYALFNEEQMWKFIKAHTELLEEIIETMRSLVPFAIHKFYEGLTEEQQALETNLQELIEDTEIIDKPMNCGPNIARLCTNGFDGFMLVIHKRGVTGQYNKAICNDNPKYFGRDLYYILCETKIMDHIVAMFPEGWIVNVSSSE